MRNSWIAFVALGICLAAADGALAQRTTANIYGLVKDSTGAVVPGVTVLLTNEETGLEQALTSNEVGEFSATFLPVGRYTLKIDARGFKSFVRKGLELTAGQQVRYPVTLEIGEVNQSVEVTSEAPLLQNATAQLSDGLSRTQLDYLPAANRDFTKLLTIQNGVMPGVSGSGLLQVNGLATAGITVTVDGVDAAGNSETPILSMFGSQNLINVLSQEAIQEVNVNKGVVSAEVGRALSGNVNVITKSGTNTFHGSLFENLRNDILNARNALLAPTTRKPIVRFNQFGGSVGGPVIKDRAFFFFAYEGYRQSNAIIVSGLTPTPEFKAQAIAALPAFQKVLDLFPKPTDSYAAGAASAFFQGTDAAAARENHIVLRGDYNLNSANRLSGRFTHGRPYAKNPTILAINPQSFNYTADSGNASWVRSAPTWTSETRWGLNASHTVRVNEAFYTNIPGIELQSHFSLGAEEMILIGHTYSLEQIFAKNLGRHTLKVGGSYFVQAPGRRDEELPVFRYANPTQMLANTTNQVQFTFGVPLFHGRTWQLAGFLQDDFRIRPNLVLNLGLRYEYYSVFKNEENTLLNTGTVANAWLQPPKFRPRDSFYNADYNNFLPRAGVAWSPDSKTVVRGGVGMSVGPMDLRNFYTFVAYDEKIIFRYRFTGADITNLKLLYPLTNPQAVDLARGATVPRSFEIFDENNPNPWALQWTFDVQRQLTPTLVVQAGYVGSHGGSLGLSHTINLQDRVTGVRPYPYVLQSNFKDAVDYSNYHAMQLSLNQRLSRRLTYSVNYTWSKNTAVSQGDHYGGNDPETQDETNVFADYGPVNLDRSHVFSGHFGYTLPDAWARSALLKQVAGGWQLGGLLRAATGTPLTVTQTSPYPFSRPNFSGNSPYAPAGNKFLYLTSAGFTRVPLTAAGIPTRPGNVGKGSLRGPGTWTVDLSLGKTFRIGERYKLGFRAEMFNALNHVNLTNPNTDVTSSLFGQIRTVEAARTMQLGLKLNF